MINILFEEKYLDNHRFAVALESFRSVVLIHKEKYRIVTKVADISQDARIVIVFGFSLNWMEGALNELHALKMHPLVFGARPRFHITPFSYLSKDYLASFYLLTKYLISKRTDTTKKIALLGFNPDSPHDLYKSEGFQKACDEAGVNFQIIPNRGNAVALIKDFMAIEDQYDTVASVSDSITLLYLSMSEEAKNKQLAGFGGFKIGSFSQARFVSCDIDYRESGIVLANLYFFLMKQKNIYPLSVKMPISLIHSGAINYQSFDYVYPKEQEIDFFHDEEIKVIESIEKMFLLMDDLDLNILIAFQNKMKFEEISEKYFVSVNTVKYRVNKMLANGEFSSRDDLFQTLHKYRISLIAEKS